MHKEIRKFPKIGRFSDVVHRVRTHHDYTGKDEQDNPMYEHSSPYPTIRFHGTVKLDGTNAAIVCSDTGISAQSRSRALSLHDDNYGFANYVAGLPPRVIEILYKPEVTIYGEWCGQGIQKGKAISSVPRRFVIFAFRDTSTEDGAWLEFGFDHEDMATLNQFGVWHILQIKSYVIDVDFNKPEDSQPKLEALAEAVGKECPAGIVFGARGQGEGVVWRPMKEPYYEDSGYWFKVKAEAEEEQTHSRPAAIAPEVIRAIDVFVGTVMPEKRLQNAAAFICEGDHIDRAFTGKFLSYIVKDVLAEEALTLKEAINLPLPEVKRALTKRAKDYWFSLCNAI